VEWLKLKALSSNSSTAKKKYQSKFNFRPPPSINVGKDAGGKGTLIHCWWKCKLVQSLWKTMWRLLKKLNIDLPYDPVIPFLGIYPKECNSSYSKGTYISMFIVALSTIAKLWKEPKCPTTGK
jgi:hypothetical protein